jgi:hypothetical protein
MTLLKRLQEENRKQARWLHALIELKDVENSLDGITANTVTAVLNEIEREVEFRQKGWIGAEEDGSDRDTRYDELQTVLDIIKSKRTEV